MTRGLCAIVGVVVVLACAAPASANTYCVPSGGAGCTNAGSLDLQSALDLALANPGPDTVNIAAGTFKPSSCASSGFAYSTGLSGNSLTLVGAGALTVLTCPDNYNTGPKFTPILQLSGPVTVSDLEIRLPSGPADRGLVLSGGSAHDLTVVSDPGASGSAIPVRMTGGSLSRSLVGDPLTDNGVGILASAGAAISDSSVTSGGTGIDGQGSPDTTVTRTRISAPQGLRDDSAGVVISDSTIDILHGVGLGTAAGLMINNGGFPGPITITARNISIGGTEPGSYGVFVNGSDLAQTATVNLSDSVIHGPPHALSRSAIPGATANVTTSYDAYPAGDYTGTGSGATTQLTPPITADPGFAAPADFHVGAGSPLIDAGTPGGLSPGESATDLDGNVRILDGNGDCAARRDIGAYEFVGDPTVHASGPSSGIVGQPISFHATGCSIDPALAVTFTWSFDDGGGGAVGAGVTHVFAHPGLHHATVVVRDGAGRSAGASVAVSVVGPGLSRLRVSPARFHDRRSRHRHVRLGTGISYTDSVAATTTLTVTERAPGVVRGKRCVAPPRHPHGRVRHCNRTVVLGSLNHRDVAGTNRLRFTGRLGRHLLGPGRYGLQAVARLAGVASRPVGATFVVIS